MKTLGLIITWVYWWFRVEAKRFKLFCQEVFGRLFAGREHDYERRIRRWAEFERIDRLRRPSEYRMR